MAIRAALFVWLACGLSAFADTTGPWDIAQLQKKDVRPVWGDTSGLVREVKYSGEPLAGKTTTVFAYYGKPATGNGPFPAVLLVHGGGGKAFSAWAEHWAKRGYCALAMDLGGNGPLGRLPDGGPDQSDDTKFRDFNDATARDMWTYHAVADVVLGHNLLRSLPEVDKNRIGVTGISWGGYLTCIVAGLDHRLKAAVPVYGCGFLQDNSVWKESRLDRKTSEARSRWVNTYDPSTYLPGVKCPILFLNGTNDFAYPMDSYQKCFDLVPGAKTLSVRVRLPHGHIWTFGEVDAFVDSQLRGGEALPVLGGIVRKEQMVSASVSPNSGIKSVQLHYAIAAGPWQKREWKTIPGIIREGTISAKIPPERPLVCELSVIDKRGLEVTTRHMVLAGSD